MLADLASSDLSHINSKYDKLASLEFWISKRPILGDGVWVMTWGAKTKGSICSAATLAFVSDDGDHMAPFIRGRRVLDSLDTRALDFAIPGLDNCNKFHKCLDTNSPPLLPSRVVDVGTSESGQTVRLIEPASGTTARYLALSYCWGTEETFKTTRDIMSKRKKGIHIKDLPQTFRDAVAVTRHIGERYLWIDSICICQDDKEDWERESVRMGAIYSGAFLVIAATGATSSKEGLFAPQKSRQYARVPYTSADGVKTHVWACALLPRKEFDNRAYVAMKDQPLSQRAWCFQERLLARRTVHFATDQTYFECQGGLTSQDGLEMPLRFYRANAHINPDEIVNPVHHMVYKESKSWGGFESNRSPISRWLALLSEYGGRRLTYPEDRLPAISGVAKDFAALLDDEYLAGMWKSSLVRCLGWQAIRCTAPSEYCAPSWSWASLIGIPAMEFNDTMTVLATVIDCGVEVDGLDVFGRVKHGWIRMEASLVKLILCEPDDTWPNILVRTENGIEDGQSPRFDTIDIKYEVSAEAVRSMDMYTLVLGMASLEDYSPSESDSESYSGVKTVYEGLIVVHVGNPDEGRFRRIGSISQTDTDFGPHDVESSRSTITLV
ncbi:uncharacterized protein DNG_10491 [Cephalotrichum gorgonifer]|uniref:Heterokaryon incompatibility domain-containing protein n=1 Tax=Cephalotrichum gorgonifer TaxID=2041049 RepID=A0AAE8N7R3_9PEZI|nr:uncharacterized protein DNG_10491 [Cephalotrichum gorgonifer]